MPTLLKAALLGFVQGLTEFLPVSSTAHLLIGERLIGYDDPGEVFAVIIQFGSILAVMWLYRIKIATVLRGLPSDPDARHFATVIIAATLPALLIGAVLADYVKTVLYASFVLIATAFIAGGIVMLLVERYGPRPTVGDAERVPLNRAVGVGLCQTLALVPGVSRSGATIIGGMALGLDRAAAAEFSFFLAMPTMAAAFGHDLLEARHYFTADRAIEIVIGFVAAFIASALVVRPFLGFVRRAGFSPFAWYRIVLGIVVLAAVARGLL
jgi:undecaprenyl-diphosphatase